MENQEGQASSQESPYGFAAIKKNYDLTFKDATSIFKHRIMEYYKIPIDAEILFPLQTETVTIAPEVEFSDLTFALSDGRGLHFEEEVELSHDDLLRFLGYQAELSRRYQREFLTVIVTLKKPKNVKIETAQISFAPFVVVGADKDADAIILKVREQIENNEPINELDLVYLPLCHSEKLNPLQLLRESATLLSTTDLVDSMKLRVLAMMATVSNKVVSSKELVDVCEESSVMAKLSFIEAALEVGENKGKIEGKIVTSIKTVFAGIRGQLSQAVLGTLTELPTSFVETLSAKYPEISVDDAYELYVSEFGLTAE
jgi:antitoxin component of RelBE/YafQ-DinJ toxin-antitoxin module